MPFCPQSAHSAVIYLTKSFIDNDLMISRVLFLARISRAEKSAEEDSIVCFENNQAQLCKKLRNSFNKFSGESFSDEKKN